MIERNSGEMKRVDRNVMELFFKDLLKLLSSRLLRVFHLTKNSLPIPLDFGILAIEEIYKVPGAGCKLA